VEAHSRRNFGTTAIAGALMGALVGATQPQPALAKKCEELTEGFGGIRYCDEVEGQGASPVKGSNIRCHYTGRLSNGRIFDTSYDRGRPLAFTVGVGQVIRGWDLGILGSEDGSIPAMKEGGKRTLIIPSELAYGSRGAGGVIPPDADLTFEVELLAPRRR